MIKNVTSPDITLVKAYYITLVKTAIKQTAISYGDPVEISEEK